MNNHDESEHSFDDSYRNKKEMFGKPYKELQEYFLSQPHKGTLLDLGCGQGRDAFFLSSIGYQVTAVDLSKVGVKQMLEKAKEKNLAITGIAGDVLNIDLEGDFDVILFDMLLHAFEADDQKKILSKYASIVTKKGMMCLVLPEDIDRQSLLQIIYSLDQNWQISDEIVIEDIPKLDDEEIDFTFVMMVFGRS